MGLIKFVAKTIGTAVLVTTGCASSIMGHLVDMAGGDSESTMWADIRNGSFDSIHKMWNSDDYNAKAESGALDIKELERNISSKRVAQNNIRKLMETAKETGQEEKYKELRDRFSDLGKEIDELTRYKNELERQL